MEGKSELIKLRKSFPVSLERTWDLISSDRGRAIWQPVPCYARESADLSDLQDSPDSSIQSGLTEHSEITLSHYISAHNFNAFVKLKLTSKPGKTTVYISFKRSFILKLDESMEAYWSGKLDELYNLIYS